MSTATTEMPLVSCLMLTRQRLPMAKRAIDCYAVQDYPRRELVILCDGAEGADALRDYAAARCSTPVILDRVERGSLSLGALRNRSIALANGDIVCQWDDDDLSHPGRVSAQVAQMRRESAGACFMTDQLLLIERTRSLYWCDWSRSRGWPLASPAIPNTLMCARRMVPAYPESGPVSRRSEDAYVLRMLTRQGGIAWLSGAGWLYVYVSHGANSWAEDHHHGIIQATGMDAHRLAERQQELTAAVAAYQLGEGIVVRDHLGTPAFDLDH